MEAKALDWLLEPKDPPIRRFTLTDVMGLPSDAKEVRIAREATASYAPVLRMKRLQGGRGYWPPDKTCYEPKFTSTVWPLMMLGEMGVPRAPWIESAVERFLAQHQMDNGAFTCPPLRGRGGVIEEVCLTGNLVRTLLLLGYGADKRVKKAIEWLPEQQMPDGGWNCDFPTRHPTHSSFMSTIEPLFAYSEIPKSQWSKRLRDSAERGAEFLLSHRVYKSHRNWQAVELRGMKELFRGNLVTMFHFPMYYYYDALHGLRILTRLGYSDDERISDAVHLVLSKKTREGRWLLEGDWVRERTDKTRKNSVKIEELGEPSKWITLNCYRVLSKTGDLELPN